MAILHDNTARVITIASPKCRAYPLDCYGNCIRNTPNSPSQLAEAKPFLTRSHDAALIGLWNSLANTSTKHFLATFFARIYSPPRRTVGYDRFSGGSTGSPSPSIHARPADPHAPIPTSRLTAFPLPYTGPRLPHAVATQTLESIRLTPSCPMPMIPITQTAQGCQS